LADAGETVPTTRKRRAIRAIVIFFMLPPGDLFSLSLKEALLPYSIIEYPLLQLAGEKEECFPG
jgi:hypothetical protein